MRYSFLLCLGAATAGCSGGGGNTGAAADSPGSVPVNQTATAPAAPAPNLTSSYTASGTEPGWTLSIGGGQMVYHSGTGSTATTATPAQRPTANGFEFLTSGLVARFTNTPCTEASGQTAPYTVEVTLGMTRPVTGCGR